MSKAPYNEDSVLRSAWRRAFSRHPVVREVILEGKRYVPKFNIDGSRSKKDGVEIHCQVCNTWVKASVKGKTNIQVDHIIPVIEVDNINGKVADWNVYKKRLFCEKANLQRICKPCHNVKTNEERTQRTIFRDTEALNEIEKQMKPSIDLAPFKKLLKRYTGVKKPAIIKQRALILRERIK